MSNIIQHLQKADLLEKMLIESGGEITPEIEQELLINPQTITELIDSKYIGLERLEMSADFFEKKAEDFKRIASSLKNAQKFIADSIKSYMIESEQTEILGQEYKFKLSSGKPKVNIVNEYLVADAYKKEKIDVSIDKASIYEDLKKGIPVAGCVLEEVYTLKKSINKGDKNENK